MLEKLKEFSQPVIALSWEDATLRREIELMGAEVYTIPTFKFCSDFEHVRTRVNHWHRLYRKTVTTQIDNRRNALFIDQRSLITKTLRDLWMVSQLRMPNGVQKLLARDEEAFWNGTNVKDFYQLFEKANPDAVFSITPFDMQEEAILRIGKRKDLPLFGAILSFDNITARTWIPVTFQHYMLWNKYNRQELLRSYPSAKQDAVSLTGPPQFDFYWDKSYLWDEGAWRKEVGLPMSAPVIFWGSGYVKIVPNETSLLLELDRAIAEGRIPEKPVILFRRHPVDFESRWEQILKQCRYVVVDAPWRARETGGKTNVSRYDIEKLVSTLYHSHVHVNVSSTLTVDGSVFDKPQIGPAYDPDRRSNYDKVLKELYLREHYLPITNSGGLDIVESAEEFIGGIRSALNDPGKFCSGRETIVREICTFDDGKSTDRVSNTLRELLQA